VVGSLSFLSVVQPENTTNVEEGVAFGYRMASNAFRSGAINHVILCSDGVANVGSTTANAILRQAKEYVGRKITLSTVGVGMGN
jgi:Ca-activated chloride channel family protein